jgi:hypothetical protein
MIQREAAFGKLFRFYRYGHIHSQLWLYTEPVEKDRATCPIASLTSVAVGHLQTSAGRLHRDRDMTHIPGGDIADL